MPPARGMTVLEAPPRVRVLLVWRHRILGEAAAALLERRDEVELVAATGRVAEAERVLGQAPVEVLLLDASLDTGRLIELTYSLKERFPHLSVVAYGPPSEERALELVEAGATAIIPSETSLEGMVQAVAGVARGPVPAPLELAARVAVRIEELAPGALVAEGGPTGGAPLSERELEVLGLVASGLRNKEIAYRLGIRTATVKNHVHSVLEKLGVRGRREAVRCAYETGLLEGSFRWRSLDAEK